MGRSLPNTALLNAVFSTGQALLAIHANFVPHRAYNIKVLVRSMYMKQNTMLILALYMVRGWCTGMAEPLDTRHMCVYQSIACHTFFN